MLSSGVRVGAAAFVVGLSLAGPQALGVASADSTDVGSVSVGAAPSPGAVPVSAAVRSAAGRAARSSHSAAGAVVQGQSSAGETPNVAVRASASLKPVLAVRDRRQAKAPSTVRGADARWAAAAAVALRSGVDVPSVTALAVSVPDVSVSGDPAAVPARAERGAAVRGLSDHGYTALQAQAVASRYMFFDGASNWLNSLPASPVTDFLQGALVLMRRTFLPYREVVPVGEGVDPYDLPTAPPANFDTGKYTWYATRDLPVVGLEKKVSLQPILRAGFGAPLLDGKAREDYSNDGVRGFIINNSKNAIVIEIDNVEDGYIDTQAVLVPGARVAFLLNTRNDRSSVLPSALFNSIYFYNWDGRGKAIGYGNEERQKLFTELTLRDPFVGYPETRFYPDGVRPYSNQRSYSEGESHSELWGQTDIWVKREYLPPQGWVPELSKEYQDRYPNSYDIDKTRDWPIFTIVVNNLFW